LQKFDLLLTISEATRRDAIAILGVPAERVANISGAVESIFVRKEFSAEEARAITRRFGIVRPFVLYTGNADYRKNLEGIIEAYARLPGEVRSQHQLVLNQVGDEGKFRRRIWKLGIGRKEIVVTSRVCDADLVALYNLCKVFVFPSFYEGFGLPIIEAMACGAPVIAANNSSLPEVMGRHDALFDASKPKAIASALQRLLSDDTLRQDLADYGVRRAREFSWEKTARLAWEAIEFAQARQNDMRTSVVVDALPKSRIAFVSPLPPQKSGIADYSAELLPYLARHFEVDLFVEAGVEVNDSFLQSNFSIYPHTDLPSRMHLYQSVVYQVGNSPFHTHMLGLLAECPGVVVLHDFFLSNIAFDEEFLKGETGAFAREMTDVHGLKGAIDYARSGHEVARRNWPINSSVLAGATSVIVHSPCHQKLLKRFYGNAWQPRVQVIPHPRKLPPVPTPEGRVQVRKTLGVPAQTFLVACFGFVAPTKLNHVVIEAFALARKNIGPHARLVFVGEMDGGSYGHELRERIVALDLEKDVLVTGYAATDVYHGYLTAADVAIQLRTDGRGETSGAMLDCLAHGLPVIVNAHGTFDDYDPQSLIKLGDPPTVEKVADALIRVAQDEIFRHELAQRARDLVEREHHPVRIAAAYTAAIHAGWAQDEKRVMENIADALAHSTATPAIMEAIATAAADNAAFRKPLRLLIDVTRITENDPRTGIERVIKNIIREFVAADRPDIYIELVRLSEGRLWRANRLAEAIFELPANALGAEVTIDPRYGDTLFMLDSSWMQFERFSMIFSQVRHVGGKVVTVVYDLIPLRHPKTCHPVVLNVFEHWLRQAISESDQLVCISQSVADDLLTYIRANEHLICRPLNVGYWHLGADLCGYTGGNEQTNENVVKRLNNEGGSPPTFLMVGTIEPRKGHNFVLDAFEHLWEQGSEVRLCIVGKEGWNVAQVMQRIRTHPETGKRLLFIEGASDAQLNLAYQSATALISASVAEGFGLPIVEAAMHGKPAIVSDIPVFREIGGKDTVYFSLQHPRMLADTILSFCDIPDAERRAMAARIKVTTWKESADRLLGIIFGSDAYAMLRPAHDRA
jgi:glycosyltransferase involved in cell wall biosynthesis